METVGVLLCVIGVCVIPIKGGCDTFSDEEGEPFFTGGAQVIAWCVCLGLIAAGVVLLKLAGK